VEEIQMTERNSELQSNSWVLESLDREKRVLSVEPVPRLPDWLLQSLRREQEALRRNEKNG
jgi:hypothetical protein